MPARRPSGRRAARDGPRGELGGPERADAKGSGEAPSAGRAAAPSMPASDARRGRSAARVGQGHGEGVSAQRAKPAELKGSREARPCERAGSTASGHGEARQVGGASGAGPKGRGEGPCAGGGACQAMASLAVFEAGISAEERRQRRSARRPSCSTEDDNLARALDGEKRFLDERISHFDCNEL